MDDDEDDQLIFESAVRTNFSHCDFKGFYQFLELFNFLESNVIDCQALFLDLNMPKINGIEVLQQLRKMKRYEKIKIIIYSTSNNPKDINDSLIAGAHAFMTKPSRIDDLVNEIKPFLENESVFQ